MSTEWIASQLRRMAAARPYSPNIPRYNPRPAGVIRPGSATDIVLRLLAQRYGIWLTHGQIVQQSGQTTKAVSWALIYLKSQDHIESTADDGRNCRYQRYQATEKGIDHATNLV
jgi:peptidoglycan/xylan/chitin deacetylase (PgdA/CDA1 family)